jgi:hypothetical protein
MGVVSDRHDRLEDQVVHRISALREIYPVLRAEGGESARRPAEKCLRADAPLSALEKLGQRSTCVHVPPVMSEASQALNRKLGRNDLYLLAMIPHARVLYLAVYSAVYPVPRTLGLAALSSEGRLERLTRRLSPSAVVPSATE